MNFVSCSLRKRHRGWWGELLQDRSSNDLSSEVRQHLESKMVDVTRHDWDERLQAIIETVPESELQPFSAGHHRDGARVRAPTFLSS